MIEQLTDGERECADMECQECSLGSKGLRIIDALTAENAVLRADSDRLLAAETRLTAATELLERAKEWVGSMRPHLEAFLAAQPAAPARSSRVVSTDHGVTITAVDVSPEERAALCTGGARLPAAPVHSDYPNDRGPLGDSG